MRQVVHDVDSQADGATHWRRVEDRDAVVVVAATAAAATGADVVVVAAVAVVVVAAAAISHIDFIERWGLTPVLRPRAEPTLCENPQDPSSPPLHADRYNRDTPQQQTYQNTPFPISCHPKNNHQHQDVDDEEQKQQSAESSRQSFHCATCFTWNDLFDLAHCNWNM